MLHQAQRQLGVDRLGPVGRQVAAGHSAAFRRRGVPSRTASAIARSASTRARVEIAQQAEVEEATRPSGRSR